MIRLQILANEITYFADMHHCAEMSRRMNTDSMWCAYRARWMVRSMELHQKLHALSSPNGPSEPRGKTAPKAEVSPSRVGL